MTDEEKVINFVLSEVIRPDGEATKGWCDTFWLIPKTTVDFLEKLRLELKG